MTSRHNPRVSVVMSVYNSGPHLRDSIRSVLSQTYTDFEFVVINDGSTDGSQQILDELAELDSRLKVLHQSNTGLTRALIRGCQLAQGEYIMRQDDDDLSHPQRMDLQVRFLDAHPEVGFVGCATRYIGPKGEPLELLTRDADPATASRKLQEERLGPPAHGGVMFRRTLYEQVGGYRSQYYLGQDSDLWLRMVDRMLFACIPEECYSFRRHAASVSSRHRDAQRSFGLLSHACRNARLEGRSEESLLSEAETLSDVVRQSRAGSGAAKLNLELNYLIGSRLAQDGQLNAVDYLWPVVLRTPWHWKAWVRLLQSVAAKLRSGKHVTHDT
jgi:glycosyltransferase involved in cell wall biosynthesis